MSCVSSVQQLHKNQTEIMLLIYFFFYFRIAIYRDNDGGISPDIPYYYNLLFGEEQPHRC